MRATGTREEIALQISQQKKSGTTLSALSSAMQECIDEGATPKSDLAAGLILTKLHSLVELSSYYRQPRLLSSNELFQTCDDEIGYVCKASLS